MARSDLKTADGAKIFVSYSRADVPFADQLVAAHEDFGYRAVIDRHDTSGGEEWKKRLGDLILSADSVVFAISPASAVTKICYWEVGETKPPERLQSLNYIYFYSEEHVPGSGFWTGLRQLNEALKVDIDWIRDQARLAERAERWAASGRPEDLLLRGSELSYFQNWRARKPSGAADIPSVQREFINASEEAQTRRENDEKARLAERDRAI